MHDMLKQPVPEFAVPEDLALDDHYIHQVKESLQKRGVEICFAGYVDVHGVPKAKANPIWAFEKMARGSELFTVGAMDGMGLVGPEKDECAAVPDLERLVICPWDKSLAWFPGTLYYRGAPYANDSRYILIRQIQRLAERGLMMNLGLEPEFYVLKQDSETKALSGLAPHRFKSICPAYDIYQTMGGLEFLRPMMHYMNELGWGLFSFDAEGGHGQYEFDAAYSDVLTMCDRLIFLRLMAKKVAESVGAVATFMPKPFASDFRNGCHFNMSLADIETKKNLFAPDSGPNPMYDKYGIEISAMAFHFMAGILKHAPALVALTSPTYNSYQGLVAQGDMPDISWAPVLVAYGKNNRSSMLRIPGNRFCVENRAPDMSCNPYLAAAFTIAAGIEGIDNALDPGEPINENCYSCRRDQLKSLGISLLPRTLLHALEAFEADPLVDEALGSEFKEIYVSWKMKEWERGFYRVYQEQLDDRLTFI